MKIVRTIVILIGALLMSSCQQNQPLQSPVVATQPKKIVSPQNALETARTYLDASKTDLSRYDMSKPEGIQEIQIQGQKAWRVSWRLRDFAGKGGQLVVIVAESGKCEQGWGE
jgi:hypothetical protein